MSRRFTVRALAFGLSWIGITLGVLFWYGARAATPSSGTLTLPPPGQTQSVLTWQGASFTAVDADQFVGTSTCLQNTTCETFTLTLDIPPNFQADQIPPYTVTVFPQWTNPNADFDLFVFTQAGRLVCEGNFQEAGPNDFRDVCTLIGPAPGTYIIRVNASVAANDTYIGHAILDVAPPAVPLRGANYVKGGFTFSTPVILDHRDVLERDRGVEPEVEVAPDGTIYVAAIQGVPAGTDLFRSDDGVRTWIFLGQPDGTQDPDLAAVRAGAGGGDTDLSIGSTGIVQVSSLWLGSATMAVSRDKGETFLVNPVATDTPEVDRQWQVATGPLRVYFYTNQLGALLVGTTSLFMVRSDDGGLTFPQITPITRPLRRPFSRRHAPAVADPNDGDHVVLTFTENRSNQIWIAESKDGARSFTLGKIFEGPSWMNTAFTWPIPAFDRSSTLHVTFSDKRRIYLMSCPGTADCTQAANWTLPARVSDGPETATALFPWIRAGDANRVDLIWYGTSQVGDSDTLDAATWDLFFAQTQNALDPTPTFTRVAAAVTVHQGSICTSGLGCNLSNPPGNRALAEYTGMTVDNQGMSLIALASDVGTHNGRTHAFFLKQLTGPSVFARPLVRDIFPCDDPRVERFGGWQILHDQRATFRHYCRQVGNQGRGSVDEPGFFLRVPFEGEAITLIHAQGPRGGNAEIFIDGVSRGVLDFFRPATDPDRPNDPQDLTFGQEARFATSRGPHTFLLKVLNNKLDPHQNMIFVEGFIVEQGQANQGSPTFAEASIAKTGTVDPLATVSEVASSTNTTALLTGILEGAVGLDLVVLDPAGAVVGRSATTDPVEVVRFVPALAGPYTFLVTSSEASTQPFTLYHVTAARLTTGAADLVAVREDVPHGGTTLSRVFPNPVVLGSGGVVPLGAVMSFEVIVPGAVTHPLRLRIYDLTGRLVARVFEGTLPPGRQTLAWDGKTDRGRPLTSGIYYVILEGGGKTLKQPFTLLRP